ncbi:MAG: bifunctional riboflavin kinase/FAD synthetase [Planctomycetaceae bacterium]
MTLRRGFGPPYDFQGGMVAIGNFDGVHRGHQQMLSHLRKLAHSHKVPTVVMTFDPHPVNILRPAEAPPALCSIHRKAELLEEFGIDFTLVVKTDHHLLSLSPERFFTDIVQEKLRARGLVEGPNFRFGKNRAGDVNTLRELCASANMTCEIVELVKREGEQISSSLIRRLIADGNIAKANELLGHAHRATGTVQPGAGRGKDLGFPTANLAGVKTLLPGEGVYAGLAWVENKPYPAAIHLGPNPTFGDRERKLEVFVLDFSGDLYESEIDVDFLERLRDVRSFSNPDDLKQQIHEDIQHVRAVADRVETH